MVHTRVENLHKKGKLTFALLAFAITLTGSHSPQPETVSPLQIAQHRLDRQPQRHKERISKRQRTQFKVQGIGAPQILDGQNRFISIKRTNKRHVPLSVGEPKFSHPSSLRSESRAITFQQVQQLFPLARHLDAQNKLLNHLGFPEFDLSNELASKTLVAFEIKSSLLKIQEQQNKLLTSSALDKTYQTLGESAFPESDTRQIMKELFVNSKSQAISKMAFDISLFAGSISEHALNKDSLPFLAEQLVKNYNSVFANEFRGNMPLALILLLMFLSPVALAFREKKKRTRLLFVLTITALLISACSGTTTQPERFQAPQNTITLTPEFLATLTPNQLQTAKQMVELFPILSNAPANRIAGIEQLINRATPAQQQIIFRAIYSNRLAVLSGLPRETQLALLNKSAFGYSGCADSRTPCSLNAKKISGDFPNLINPGEADMLKISVLDSRTVGAQPTLFPPGTKSSIFAPHKQDCFGEKGCGLLGGVQMYLTEGGEQKLLDHHVPPATVKEIKRLIDIGNDGQPLSWAERGALIQAKMNNHDVLFGTVGHADNTFAIEGIVKADGAIIKGENFLRVKDQYRELVSLANLLHNPQPVLEALTTQAPEIIMWSFSKKITPANMLGEYGLQPGKIFVQSLDDLTPTKSLNLDQIRKVMSGGAYGSGHLPNSRVLTIVADSLGDLARIEAELMLNREAYALDKFLADGGVLIKLIPDGGGGYKLMALENAATFGKGQITLELANEARAFKQVSLTNEAAYYLTRVAEVKLNAGLISIEQYNAAIVAIKGLKNSIAIGSRALEVVGLYYLIGDAANSLANVHGKGPLTSALMPIEVDDTTGRRLTEITVSQSALARQHASAVANDISPSGIAKKTPSNMVGMIFAPSIPDPGAGTDVIATFNKTLVFFLLTSSPIREIQPDGTIIHDPFTTENKNQPISLVTPEGYVRTDVASETVVASFIPGQQNILYYWNMIVDPASKTITFKFLKLKQVNPNVLKENLKKIYPGDVQNLISP